MRGETTMGKIGKRWGKKVTYLRDWKKVNETHVLRGEYLLDFDWVKNWSTEVALMNQGKKGAPYQFPESLIKLQAVWALCYNYRAVEGITRQVCSFAKVPQYNDFSTICRRVNALTVAIPLPKGKEISAATDGSGMKMNMSGEYFEEKYGDGKKKFLKVTITADPFQKDLLKVEVALEGEGNSEPTIAEQQMKELIEEGYTIDTFFMDGAGDTHALFDFCDQQGIDPVIKIRDNAVIDSGGGGSWKRAKEVEKYQQDGYKEWARKKHYGRRWPGTEGMFSAVKRMFGERVRSHKIENMCNEVYRKFWAYQTMKYYAERRLTV